MIAAAEAQAIARATEAGADPATITAVEVEDMPLAYLPGNALRVRVRVAGEMVGEEYLAIICAVRAHPCGPSP